MKECPVCRRCFADHINHCPTDGDLLSFSITGDPVLDGRYQLEQRIAKGGMGVVYKGRHIFLKTPHAIKIILPDLVGNDPSLATRFRQEAMAAAAIHHQNIIAVTDYGVINGTTPFLVMEYIQGKSLQDIINEEGRLSPARALEILAAVAAGVGAAHRQGIVHRDLKPLNIMLRKDVPPSEGIKVLDFGLAKIKSGELLGSFVAAQTTGMMGSPFYMAPEQWEDEEPTRAADIYSMGVILYQMLAGDVPFKGTSVPSIMKMHCSATPPPFIDRGIPVAAAVERAVLHALEKEPENRPPTVEAFVEELRHAIASANAETTRLAGGGMETVNIVPSDFDTAMSPLPTSDRLAAVDAARGGASSNVLPPPAGVLPTVTDGRDALPSQDAAQRPTETLPAASDTARQQEAEQTAQQRAAEEAAARRRAEDEAERARRVAEENARLEAEAAHRRREFEDGERLRREAEAAQQRQQEEEQERVRRQAEQRAEAEAAAERARQWEAQKQAQKSVEPPREAVVPPQSGVPPPHSVAASPVGSRVPLLMVTAVVALALLGVLAGLAYVVKTRIIDKRNSGGELGDPSPTPTPAASPVETSKLPVLVELPGGTFLLGRRDVPPRSSGASQRNQAWLYNQWPVQRVRIERLAIYKNEVTNAEYAEFVSDAAYPPPPDWDGNRPRAGQERWPVRNVTFEDANRFAIWRSARDKVTYRLPTEAEWEYAARGGDASRLYPWGGEWIDGRANLDAETLKPVGSFPDGATPQGALDMIGNVWEWTSSEAAMYRGNDVLALSPDDRNKIVVRGGSFQSSARGDELITATARRWVSRDKRDPTLGFRLVRE